MKCVGFPEGLGYERDKVEKWFAKVEADPSRYHFVVIPLEAGFFGETYFSIDRDHNRASLDIKLIPQAQGQGLATDALSPLIQHVFEVEGVRIQFGHSPRRQTRLPGDFTSAAG